MYLAVFLLTSYGQIRCVYLVLAEAVSSSMILNQLRYCALVTYSDLSDTLQIYSRFLWQNFQCHLFLVYSACLCFRLPFFNTRFIRIEMEIYLISDCLIKGIMN